MIANDQQPSLPCWWLPHQCINQLNWFSIKYNTFLKYYLYFILCQHINKVKLKFKNQKQKWSHHYEKKEKKKQVWNPQRSYHAAMRVWFSQNISIALWPILSKSSCDKRVFLLPLPALSKGCAILLKNLTSRWGKHN